MRISATLLLALLLVSFPTGCTSGTPSADSDRITLVFKHGKLAGDPRPLQALLRRFEVEHPTIRVRSEPLPSSTDQQHQIYAINLEGGAGGIDVLALDVIWVPEFARAGWILPLDDLFGPEERAVFFPNAIQAVTYRGRVWAVPWYIDAGVLYYRKDLLAKYRRPPPSTWPELVETVRLILDGERNPRLYGFIWQGRQYEGLVCNALEFIRGNGGDPLDPAGQPGALAQPAVVDALTFMRDLIHTYRTSPAFVTTADEETSRHLFGSGRAVFTRNWPYAWALFERDGSPVSGKVGISPVPRFGAHRPAPTLGGWHLGIARESRYPAAAWRLIEFLASHETQKAMALAAGIEPTRTALYEDPDLLAVQPVLTQLRGILAEARPRPVTPFYPMVSQILQSEFSAVLAGLRSPEAAMRSAERELAHVLRMEDL
jgi:multiple sugar transport system substrate-binding protein